MAMASAVAAVPHYGAHYRFHHKAAGTDGAGVDGAGTGGAGTGGAGADGAGHPYPTGGWLGSGYNTTAAAGPTGGSNGHDTDIDVTSTYTTTVLTTIYLTPTPTPTPSPAPAPVVENFNPGNGGQCGPATVTVTASERITITVTPGGGAGAPSSLSPSPSTPCSTPSSSSPTPVASSTPAAASSKPPVVAQAASSVPAYTPIPAVPVASSVAASSAAPSPTPNAGGGNTYTGSKRGLAYNEAHLCKNFGAKFGFGYNWGQVENNDIGTAFIPMMHNPGSSSVQEWLGHVDSAAKKGSKAVMGFNECDIASQCNMSPEAACAAWKTYMNPIASSHSDMTIIGPSVSNSGSAGQGLDWLSTFHKVCPDATVHATNIHFYDVFDKGTIDRFKAQVEKAAQLYGMPVWITEFALNPGSATEAQAASFLKDCMAYLDSSSHVQGYSWFMVGTGENQLNSGNGLSALGQVYVS
ncbi:hypothetical protein ACEQ8H_001053 [Pleosporales sp. CAS-2024a]